MKGGVGLALVGEMEVGCCDRRVLERTKGALGGMGAGGGGLGGIGGMGGVGARGMQGEAATGGTQVACRRQMLQRMMREGSCALEK